MNVIGTLLTLRRGEPKPEIHNLYEYGCWLVWRGVPEREAIRLLADAGRRLEARQQQALQRAYEEQRRRELMDMRAEGIEGGVARLYGRLGWNHDGGPDGTGPVFSTAEPAYEPSPDELFRAGEWING